MRGTPIGRTYLEAGKPVTLGQRFGRWTVMSTDALGAHKYGIYWRCVCDCGTERDVSRTSLREGDSTSCGCRARELLTKHGKKGDPLYSRWRAMIGRTTDPNNANYANYGARGVTVCDRWRDFSAFYSDMHEGFEPHLELDRIQVDGDYGPENCRWVTRTQNQRNKRTNTRIEFGGRLLIVEEWAELLGVKSNTISARLYRGWTPERALTHGLPVDVLRLISAGVS